MELLKGRSLREAMDRDGCFHPDRAIHFLEQVLAALRSSHENDEGEPILHLELKPQNILMVEDPARGVMESVKIIDFGAGRLRQAVPTLPGSTGLHARIRGSGALRISAGRPSAGPRRTS
jgi:serine/threonine protein kinase